MTAFVRLAEQVSSPSGACEFDGSLVDQAVVLWAAALVAEAAEVCAGQGAVGQSV